MNDRDRALGRLLLQRNLCTREVLQQAGQTTLARRQAGQQVEILVVLVEMGVLETAVARQLWSEVAGGAAVTPAPPPRPPRVEDASAEFSPVSTLSTMGEAPPAVPPGYSPLAASTRPGTGSFVRPATGSFARPASGSYAGPASGSYAGPAPGSYAGPAPAANGAFFVDDAPTLGGAPPPGAF
ncbi:MAG: hypothetical protein KIT58_21285, partial [Planctomycetota bacterium]|nr:hypothetical protein [Planctomycetota bacterium]